MENTVVIREFSTPALECAYTLDLQSVTPKDCIGCWTCWWAKPGHCVHHDLDDFYRAYVHADRLVIFSRLSLDFVSGNLKTVFDRILPLALPYMDYKTGESMHVPRYEKYPRVDVYYEGEFSSPEAQKIYEDYIRRVFYQFWCKCGTVAPVSQFYMKEVAV